MFSVMRQGVFRNASRRIILFRSIAAGFLALRCCSCRKGLNALLSLKPHGFSFLLHEQKKRNKENSPSALFCLLQCFSTLNKKNSLSLKQLFVFNAPKSTSALRQKSEAGPLRFYLQHYFARWGLDVFFSLLVGCRCFLFASHVAIASFPRLLPAFNGEA